VPAARIQPIAADDAARAVGRVAAGAPIDGIVEIGGPEAFRFEDLVQYAVNARNDSRHVVADPDALYFGAKLADDSLLPGENPQLGETRFEDWLGALTTAG
jgi:uncharacterized protein YbjT (DUF2867 family)